MRYTPGQLRDLVGLSQETLRHWRTTLPPLQGSRGRAPYFTAGQVLGTATVKAVIDEFGLPVRSLRAASSSLFAICSQPNWEALGAGHLAIVLRTGDVTLLKQGDLADLSCPTILFPLSPVIEKLRTALLGASGDQTALSFPPVSIARAPRASRSVR